MTDASRPSFYLPAQDATEPDTPDVKKKSFSKKMAKSFKKMGTQVKDLMTPRGSNLLDFSPTPSAKSVEGSAGSRNLRTLLTRASSDARRAAKEAEAEVEKEASIKARKESWTLPTGVKAGTGEQAKEPKPEWSNSFSTASKRAMPSSDAGIEDLQQGRKQAKPAAKAVAAPKVKPVEPEVHVPTLAVATATRVTPQPTSPAAVDNAVEVVQVAVQTGPVSAGKAAAAPGAAKAPSTKPRDGAEVTPAPSKRQAPAAVVIAAPAAKKHAKRESSAAGGFLRGMVWLAAATAAGVLAARQLPAARRPHPKRA